MSWKKVKLGDFLKNREGRFKPNNESITQLKRIEKIDFSGIIYLSEKVSNTDMILVKKGDLVISGINVEKGAMSVYEGEEDITATIHYSSYSFDEEKIDIEFLKYFLKSPEFKDAIKEQVPGGIKTEIKPKHLLPLQIFIPSNVNEQRKVIAEFKEIEKDNLTLNTELNDQLDTVKKLRQAFLREAMQGKLIEQNLNDEPASELLKKIKAEKEKLPNKRTKEKPLAPIKPEEIPFEIPANWVWCRLGEIVDILTDYHANGAYEKLKDNVSMTDEENYAIMLRTTNFHSKNYFEYKYITQEAFNFLEKSKVYPGDLIMNKIGDPGTVFFVDDRGKPMSLAMNLFLLRLNSSISNYYIYSYLKLQHAYIRSFAAGTTSMTITKDAVKELLVPLPPLAEQQRIVNKLEKLMSFCDELEKSIKQSKEQNEKLLQQVLREALNPS